MKRLTLTRFFVISLFLFTALSCNLADTISGGNAPQEPTAPVVVYVTATPQPTLAPTATPTPTATPEVARLTVLPCLDYPDDCPAAVHSNEFYEPAPPFEYTFDIPSSTQLFVSTGWGAIDKATLEQNMPFVDFFLEIDGEDYYSDLYTVVTEIPDAEDQTKMNGVIFLNIVVSGWVPHEAHTIVFGYVITAPINDGWDDYDEGFSGKTTMHICPDGGCAASSSSTDGDLTLEACPAAADCPAASNIYSYIEDFSFLQSGKEVTVEVPQEDAVLFQTGFYTEAEYYVSLTRPKIDFFFELDGVDLLEESFIGTDSMPDLLDATKTRWGNTVGVAISGWKAGEQHRVRIGYITTAEIYDGKETWPPGSTIDVSFLILPVE